MNLEPVEFLSISDLAKNALEEAGVVLVENVMDDRNRLETILLRTTQRDDENYLKQLGSDTPTESCFDLLLQERQTKLRSGLKKLDQILEGGFKPKSITEICGLPGSGKTQLCMQLSAFCQLPENLGGLSGQTLYIDTNFGFSPERFKEICNLCGNHASIDPLVLRISSTGQLIAAIKATRDYIVNNQNIKLIIIDSISRPFLFKQVTSTLMSIILMDLHSIASEFNLVVIITTQMTSKPTTDQSIKHQSALRSGYLYYVNERLTLYQFEGQQLITLFKKSAEISST